MTPLTLAERDRDTYREQGFLGPVTLMPVKEMEALRPALAAVLRTAGPGRCRRSPKSELPSPDPDRRSARPPRGIPFLPLRPVPTSPVPT